jgi:hypothetical protein
MFSRSVTLLAAALVMASTPALAIMPRPGLPRPPLPPNAIVLAQGGEFTLEARLSVKNLEGKHAWASQFTRPVYERQAVYYPAVHRVGIGQRPRPPFVYREIEHLMLTSAAGHDLVALAKLVGPDAKVTVTGTYQDSPRTMTMVLKVTKVEIRGQEVPAELPTVQRMIALAKKAVQAHVSSLGEEALSLTAKHLGGLRVRVSARLDGAGTQDYIYDALTFDVVAVGTPE